MTDINPTFDIFGPATRDDIRVGYISTERGMVDNVSICEANELAKKDPGMVFIFRDRKKIQYININQVNDLTVNDLLNDTTGNCGISTGGTEDAVGIASVKGITVDFKDSECKPEVQIFGGGGLGVLANPVIGKDGSVLAVDANWPQGYGYEYKPTARVVDPCGIGAGAVLKVIMVEGNEPELIEYIEYDDEEDFEEYKICPKNEVGYGKRYNIRGTNDGEWDPNSYFDGGVLTFEQQLEKYKDFLLNAPNPFWTTRSQVPTKTTSGTKVSREKYDVNHWAWGSVPNPPGLGTIVDNLYLELFGRKAEPGGFEFWQRKLDSGVSREDIRLEMMTMPEYALVQREGRFALNSDVWLGGAYFKPDLKNFMNSYAISPVPISNVIPSDFGGVEHYFEWDIDFPHEGEYIFRFQCDNEGILYVDGEKKGEYKIGKGGAAGSVLSPPEETKVDIKKAGTHKIRVDLFNGKVMKKVAEQQKLDALATSDEVKFDIQLSTMYGASATIEGLDISYEKTFGVGKDIFDSITKKVEFGRVYDVKITSNNKRTGNLPATNKELIFDGLHPANNPINVINQKQLALKDGDGNDTNASFTIDNGNATFAADGRSLIGTGEQTLTLSWSDRRTAGRAINNIKLGNTVWQRTGSGGSVTHTITLGGGIGQIGGENNQAHLRTKGQNVLQMEDIPGTDAGGGGVGNFYDDVVITADQGIFFDINGLNAKYTLGDRPLENGSTSTESSSEIQNIFNTSDFIDKADRPLWKTNLVTTKDSSFTNRYGISPFDTGVKYESSMAGIYTIRWHNVNFPVSGDYDIGIGVDDNVRLRIVSNTHTIGTQVDIKKDGFLVRGDGRTATGTSLYRRFIEAGTYTIEADLEQVEGGDLGFRNVAGADVGGNPMSLSINIDTVFTEKKVQAQKSWNQNPLGVAMTIEAPDPPVPQEIPPKHEGRCPPNPFWSTRFPSDGDQWYPFIDQRKVYKYAVSPIIPYGQENTSGGSKTYTNTWEIVAPYDGFYKLKATADDSAVISFDGEEVLRTVGVSSMTSQKFFIKAFNDENPPKPIKHTITVDVSNVGQEVYDTIDKRIFTTQGWSALGTEVDQTLNTNDVEFKFSTASLYGSTSAIEELDIFIEKIYGEENVSETFTRKVEFDKVYDVKLTSNTRRVGNLPAGNKALVIDGKGVEAVNRRRPNPKRLEFDDNGANGFDINATFTIDSGNATFAEDGLSVKGTGEQTITLWWNDRRRSGRAINSIKLGNTVWQRSGSGGSVTHTITLGGGIGQLGGVNNEAKLRARGNKIIQMEDIPGFDEEVTYDDLVLSVDQGRFFDINGLTCKYTLGDRPAESGVSSTEKADEVTTIFNTTDFIDKANRPLWRTVPNVSKDSPFTNRYGITPFDPSLTYEGAQEGTHEIKWHNVRFPVSGEYDIGIGVDDNVRLRIGSDVDIFKQGFTFEGSETTFDSFGAAVSAVGQGKFSPTGTSLYRRFIKAGVYTVIADLEQIPGGKYGVVGGNTMGLAINIDTVFTERDVQAQRSWNQNPFGVALTIDAPDPPIPQEPLPVQEGRCPPNPFWSTRYPNADEQWFPFSDRRQIYRYAISPIKPYGEENTSGGGQTYSNTWKIDAPYDGFYKLKAAADDNAVIKLDGNEILRTEGLSEQTVKMVEIAEGEHQVTVEVTNIAQETFDAIDKRIFTTQGWSALGTEVEQTLNTNEVEFKFSTNTMYGNTLEIPGLDVSLEKKFGDASTQVRQDFSRKVVFGQVYDVIITSNNRRVGNLPAGNKELQFNGLHPVNNPINVTSNGKRLALRDGDGNDTNASFTIDNGNGTFAADGKSIVGTGEQTLTLSWSDRRQAGRAINSIKLGNTIWQRTGSGGSVTHTTNLGGGVGQLGGDNNLAHLRTKGENVIEMEDIPGLDEEVTYDDLVLSASQGRFFDINGLNAKFVLEKKTKTVLQGGVGSGTVKDGVVYSGPELFHKNFSGWGAFMNRASLSQNPFVANSQVVNYTWSNVDFPEDGEYQVKFSNDAHASLYLDGKEIVRGNFDNEAGVSAQDESNWNGEGTFRKVLINKGKHTLAVKPTSLGLIDTLFKQPAGYKWHENPSGFAIEIRKKIQVVRTDGTGKPVAKSWKDNPVLVSAHLIPPPCPKKVEGIGTVDKVIPIDPGNGYPPPSDPDDNSNYNVALELTNVIVDDGGINYSPDDKVVITGRPGDPVIPPFSPKLDQFGTIIDIPVPPIDSGLNVVPIGFTGTPDITIETDSGIGFSGIPEFTVVRTPPVEFVDPDRLLQVTDLVGLKQTGYYNGKPYYGAIFYKDGIKYAGYYETAGQLVQIYDTLQESIDGEVTTAPSAIQRQGTDITSSDPTLNIPNTPDNLTY